MTQIFKKRAQAFYTLRVRPLTRGEKYIIIIFKMEGRTLN